MLIGKPPDIPSSEITPLKDYRTYLDRRRFLRRAVAAGRGGPRSRPHWPSLIAPGAPLPIPSCKPCPARSPPPASNSPASRTSPTTTTITSSASTRTDPARNAGALPTRPWKVKVEGKVNKPQIFDIDTAAQTAPARRPRLSPSLRRGLEHGHSLGGLLALRIHQAVRSAAHSQIRAVPLLLQLGRREVGRRNARSTGPIPRACAWTKP